MTEQQPSPEWGAPQPEAKRPAWTAKKTVAAAAIAVGIAAAGGVAIYAASGTNQQTAGMGGPGGMGGTPPDGGNGMRGPGFGLGSGSATHGEFQTGEVTSISDTSLEVKSTDGYTKTYVIDADTVKEGVEQGDTVTVIATTEDGKTVASSVVEPGQRGQQGRQTPPTR
ncbi:hypothetical protein [Lentzea terrae]|uniref:hypothetical protein n=1 Tax=Lentzea terrae TaxID=2200761 RepID=UPI0013008725|nr:hypothetical protein [Lentzea terrae]